MPATLLGYQARLAELPCRPTLIGPNAAVRGSVTHRYARHVFLNAEIGAACKCGRYHIVEWRDGRAVTDVPTREVEIVVVAGRTA